MKNKILSFLFATLLMNDAVAQLEPTRISNVFTLDTKGGRLAIANDSTQFIFKEGTLQILSNYKTVAEIFDNSIKEFTEIANKGGTEKGIFLVTPSRPSFRDNSLNFLSRIDFENKKIIPVPMSVEPQLKYLLEKFETANYFYDKIMNDIYFKDILNNTMIRYDIDENQFSVVPFYISGTPDFYYADSGYVYYMNYAWENPNVVLQSFHYTNPDERTDHPEINRGKPRSFVFSDDGKKMYVNQNGVTYLISGNTLQKMTDYFVVNIDKQRLGGTNLEKGLVEIFNNNGAKIDELQLEYDAVQSVPLQSKTIITYNSNRALSESVAESYSSSSSVSASDGFPYSIPFFRQMLTKYGEERNDLFTSYNHYIDCMKTGTHSSCNYLSVCYSKDRAERLLKECKEFQELLEEHKSVFLENVDTDYSTTKQGFESNESTFKDIIRISK